MRAIAIVFLWCHSSWMAVSVAQESPLEIGLNKQLLVDDFVIAQKRNLTRRANQAIKHGVVLKPTLPSDFQTGGVHDGPDGGAGYEFGESCFCWFFSPHYDTSAKKFRLWYMASKRPGSALAYAESNDGLHWTKPLIADGGKTNLVTWTSPLPILGRGGARLPLLDFGLDGVTVTIDPRLPFGHAEKFKCGLFPNVGGGDCRTRLGYSQDGIHWSWYGGGAPVTGRAADFSNQIVWDPNQQRYLLLCREDFAAGGGLGELRGVRIMEHTQGGDLQNHPAAWKTLTKFVLNDPDPALIPGTSIPVRQIHTFPIWYYEGIWFGLTDVLAATNRPVEEGQQDYFTRHERGVWEFYLSPSRDAVTYDFTVATYPRSPLVPRGPNGSFDKDCARPPTNIITHQDAHWIYYLATNERWGARKWDARLALAKLRLDGFFSLDAGDREGTLLTKPIKLEGSELELNVAAPSGRLQVELLGVDGQPLDGFSGNDAFIAQDVDSLRLPIRFRAKLGTLKGRAVRLKISLRAGKLFAFQVRP